MAELEQSGPVVFLKEAMKVEKFEIKNRYTGAVMYVAMIACAPSDSPAVKMGMAVKNAVAAGANLAGANLAGAYLVGANLAGANLAGAYLVDAYLADANLAGANFADAYLVGAYLAGAYLAGANLADANLADAKNAELAIARTRIVGEGSLIGWKKCLNGVIVKMRIPEDAPRSHAFGRKCRAGFVDVIEVIGAEFGVSQYDRTTTYRAGERVTCGNWCEDWQRECAGGIHFFITREEAEAH